MLCKNTPCLLLLHGEPKLNVITPVNNKPIREFRISRKDGPY